MYTTPLLIDCRCLPPTSTDLLHSRRGSKETERDTTSDDATVRQWQAIARDKAWKDYAERSETCKTLMAAAQKLIT
jgi:hypothetical protein